MNQKDYIRKSLELHLFFDRIMKEHSFFLEAAFMEKDSELKKVANTFQKRFSDILERITYLSNGNISNEVIMANEFITKDTLEAEEKTSKLSGITIDTSITIRQKNLKSGETDINEQLLNNISFINKKTLSLVDGLIRFKNNILKQVLSCKLYTTNYPLLITHFMNEAKMYYDLLSKVENREVFSSNYLYEQEVFWNNIMKEHAEFIRGLLDPSENELILTADQFSLDYEDILKKYVSNSNELTKASLDKTIQFRDFKIAGEKGILNCKIKSIIIPLLADHVLREANHFIRILKSL